LRPGFFFMLISTLIAVIKKQHQDNRGQPEFIRGQRIYRGFWSTERYVVDFADDRAGWLQFDTNQDASYFGVWVNRRTLQSLSYAEGDWSLTEFDSVLSFNEELDTMCSFYDEGYAFKSIDFDTKTITTHRQDRLEFYIPLGV